MTQHSPLLLALPPHCGDPPPAPASPIPTRAFRSRRRSGAHLARLAELESTAAALHRTLRKTARRLQALEQMILPAYQADLHAVLADLEEEERDDAVRRRAWLSARAQTPDQG